MVAVIPESLEIVSRSRGRGSEDRGVEYAVRVGRAALLSERWCDGCRMKIRLLLRRGGLVPRLARWSSTWRMQRQRHTFWTGQGTCRPTLHTALNRHSPRVVRSRLLLQEQVSSQFLAVRLELVKAIHPAALSGLLRTQNTMSQHGRLPACPL
jgi:hypothetical protein